ncbi:polysaccharide deacetylase family protein [Paenibacillus glycinis]|uniref:Polysaccharide deacetylase n=1 Tax=Paenibacillus glycinis TaxID=2697035 RepID=A0ABW9XNK3_9BACL|nr:polysaccharide deacetylase [Paenibacillus glycinis]NBD24212.1 polysaccharide deacetylase [Paenibacillus glycinis]
MIPIIPIHSGVFVISLDFELFWGVRDIYKLAHYKRKLSLERKIVPQMLELFSKNGIHASWATVGLLFFYTKDEMLESLPSSLPDYSDSNLSPYRQIKDVVGQNEQDDPYHFAPSLIRLIQETNDQRVSTHTFSHYYCKEDGQRQEEFSEDLRAAVSIADKRGIPIESIVFPRNQINPAYLQEIHRHGIMAYRGNQPHWLYRNGYSTNDPLYLRAFRLLDTYFNFSGHHVYALDMQDKSLPVNVPASHFFRPYSRKLRWIERFRLRRILKSMTEAAKTNTMYHLWWHPYNLADDPVPNMSALMKIINHYRDLNRKYGMVSMNMEEVSEYIRTASDSR